VREWIESKAGSTIFERLALSVDDQKAFQSLSLDMLKHLDPDPGRGKSTSRPPGRRRPGGRRRAARTATMDQDSGTDERRQQEIASEGARATRRRHRAGGQPGRRLTEGDIGDESEEGMMPVRPNRPWTDDRPISTTRSFTEEFDEVIAGNRVCDEDELTRPARLSRQPADGPAGSSPSSPTGSAAADGAGRNRSCGLRPGRGPARRRAARPRNRQPRFIRSATRSSRTSSSRTRSSHC